jgi:branched-subunit amino acid transport protein
MHPSRPTRTADITGLVDRLTDWLASYCPFSSLTLLLALVVSSLFTVPRPVWVAAAAVGADIAINVGRRLRPRRRHAAALR